MHGVQSTREISANVNGIVAEGVEFVERSRERERERERERKVANASSVTRFSSHRIFNIAVVTARMKNLYFSPGVTINLPTVRK